MEHIGGGDFTSVVGPGYERRVRWGNVTVLKQYSTGAATQREDRVIAPSLGSTTAAAI